MTESAAIRTPNWRKSSRSGGNNNCVEVATDATPVLVRDTKDRAGGTLEFAGSDWVAFIAAVRDGEIHSP